jgi:hypothetical protein
MKFKKRDLIIRVFVFFIFLFGGSNGIFIWQSETGKNKQTPTTPTHCDTKPPKGSKHHQSEKFDYWTSPDGKRVGAYMSWYDSQKKLKKIFCCYNLDGLKVGRETCWHPNGKKKWVYKFRGGKKHGRFKIWYKNGQVSELGSYRNNKKHGKYKSFDKDGKQLSERLFKEDKWGGLKITFDTQGRRSIEKRGTIKNGKFTGKIKYYKYSPKRVFIEDIKDGKKVKQYWEGEKKSKD